MNADIGAVGAQREEADVFHVDGRIQVKSQPQRAVVGKIALPLSEVAIGYPTKPKNMGRALADLLDDLLAKPQRETVGSNTSLRFDYQKDWAFCQMLRRHMDGADYLVAFEFHDDVVFLESQDSPGTAEFFQVKTSTSATARTLATLTSRRGKGNSILGKLFKNFSGICSGHEVKVVLVSNIAFEFAGADLCATDIEPKFRKKIIEKLKAELPDFVEQQVDSLHFMITGVSLDAMRSYLRGEAMELFKTKFGEEHGLNVYGWVRLLQSEITRKNNYPSDKIANVNDLISKKCIDREFVEQTIALVSDKARKPIDMALVNAELKTAGWNGSDLMRLGKKLPTAASDYTNATNIEAADLVARLEGLFAKMAAPDLSKFIAEAESTLLTSLGSPYRDRIYLAAMCVLVFHEKI